jgi:hypothetical protein
MKVYMKCPGCDTGLEVTCSDVKIEVKEVDLKDDEKVDLGIEFID